MPYEFGFLDTLVGINFGSSSAAAVNATAILWLEIQYGNANPPVVQGPEGSTTISFLDKGPVVIPDPVFPGTISYRQDLLTAKLVNRKGEFVPEQFAITITVPVLSSVDVEIGCFLDTVTTPADFKSVSYSGAPSQFQIEVSEQFQSGPILTTKVLHGTVATGGVGRLANPAAIKVPAFMGKKFGFAFPELVRVGNFQATIHGTINSDLSCRLVATEP
jgi:hypothetical protein